MSRTKAPEQPADRTTEPPPRDDDKPTDDDVDETSAGGLHYPDEKEGER